MKEHFVKTLQEIAKAQADLRAEFGPRFSVLNCELGRINDLQRQARKTHEVGGRQIALNVTFRQVAQLRLAKHVYDELWQEAVSIVDGAATPSEPPRRS